MKRWIVLLIIAFFAVPLAGKADVAGYIKERMGSISGQVVMGDGQPVGDGGVVSFFNTEKGIQPMISTMHRIPDMVARMTPDGKFTAKLVPGTFYMGVLIITDPGRGPGPPRKGEKFYFVRDDKGKLREFTVGIKEVKDVGQVIGALPDSFPEAKNYVTVTGKLLKDGKEPFVGGVVLVKSDMNNARPDFVSEHTVEDGIFTLQLPAETPYYLLGRERAVGRPVPGTYVGTYGSTSAIAQGGALPIGNVQPAQPASGRPEMEGVVVGPGEDLPLTVVGKAGETLTGIDIMMFKMPVPGEQREQLQGTLGFGEEKAKEMDKVVPGSK